MDKLKHLGIGLVVACAVYVVTGSLAWTWCAVIVIGAAKEARDATGRGHVEYRDFVATILPAMVPTIYHMQPALVAAGIGP
jgi:hypothetical protein